MHTYLLEQGFAPFSERLASVFVMDLQTGDTFTINDGVAFSGMSLTKIAILAAYFQRLGGPLSADQAFLVADTMMCSENITTNQLLEQIGDGDSLRGAQRVTAFMQGLGLNGTFIMRQYVLSEDETAHRRRDDHHRARTRSAPARISIIRSCPKTSVGCWPGFTSARITKPGC